MATAQARPVNDDSLIEVVVSSKKNLALMRANGLLTVGDVKKKAMSELVDMGLGEVTLGEIKDALNPAPERDTSKDEVEEGPQPIHIRSPYSGFSLQVLPGDSIRNENGRGIRPVRPIYIVCYMGQGKLTAEMWFMRKFKRDRVAVDTAIQNNEPWRKEAVAWLRARKSHGPNFQVMTD